MALEGPGIEIAVAIPTDPPVDGPGVELAVTIPDNAPTGQPAYVAGPAAARVFGRLRHLLIDPESDALLERLVGGLAAGLERAHIVAYGTDTCPAERILTDPVLCPDWALPHAALYTGGTMPARRNGETDSAYIARARISVVAPAVLPGTIGSILAAGRATLTGSQTIRVFESYESNPWRTMLFTSPGETPDPAEFLAAVNDPAVVLGGGRVEHTLLGGTSWDDLTAGDISWNDLNAITWGDLDAGVI